MVKKEEFYVDLNMTVRIKAGSKEAAREKIREMIVQSGLPCTFTIEDVINIDDLMKK